MINNNVIKPAWLVKIETPDGYGSGIVVSKAGHILTCYHNIINKMGRARSMTIIPISANNNFGPPIKDIENNISIKTPPKDLIFAETYDLLALNVNDNIFQQTIPPQIATELPEHGENVIVLGYDNRSGGHCRIDYGRVIDIVQGGVAGTEHFRINIAGYEGMSGGGVFNKEGTLIGLMVRIDKERKDEIIATFVHYEKIDIWIPKIVKPNVEEKDIAAPKIEQIPPVVNMQSTPVMNSIRRLTNGEIDQLATLLLKCSRMRDARDAIVDKLPDEIKYNIAGHNVSGVQVINIIKACNDYDDGINLLIKAVKSFEKNSIAMKNVEIFISGLTK